MLMPEPPPRQRTAPGAESAGHQREAARWPQMAIPMDEADALLATTGRSREQPIFLPVQESSQRRRRRAWSRRHPWSELPRRGAGSVAR